MRSHPLALTNGSSAPCKQELFPWYSLHRPESAWKANHETLQCLLTERRFLQFKRPRPSKTVPSITESRAVSTIVCDERKSSPRALDRAEASGPYNISLLLSALTCAFAGRIPFTVDIGCKGRHTRVLPIALPLSCRCRNAEPIMDNNYTRSFSYQTLIIGKISFKDYIPCLYSTVSVFHACCCVLSKKASRKNMIRIRSFNELPFFIWTDIWIRRFPLFNCAMVQTAISSRRFLRSSHDPYHSEHRNLHFHQFLKNFAWMDARTYFCGRRKSRPSKAWLFQNSATGAHICSWWPTFNHRFEVEHYLPSQCLFNIFPPPSPVKRNDVVQNKFS